MEITESLLTALTLLALGMAFVFMFLGLLMIAVVLMEKFIAAEPDVAKSNTAPSQASVATSAEINPKLIAAITSAVQQHRAAESV